MGRKFDAEVIRDYDRLQGMLDAAIGAIEGCIDAASSYADRPPYQLREEPADFTMEDYAADTNPTATILRDLKRDLLDRVRKAKGDIDRDLAAAAGVGVGPGRPGDWCA